MLGLAHLGRRGKEKGTKDVSLEKVTECGRISTCEPGPCWEGPGQVKLNQQGRRCQGTREGMSRYLE